MTTINALIDLANQAVRTATHRLDTRPGDLSGPDLDTALDAIEDLTGQLQQLCQRLALHQLQLDGETEAVRR